MDVPASRTRKLSSRPQDDGRGADGVLTRLDSPSGGLLVEVKRSSNIRDLRAVLINLTYALNEDDEAHSFTRSFSPPASALCVLVESRVTPSRLKAELDLFRAIVGERFRDRVFATVASDQGTLAGELPSGARHPEVATRIQELVRKDRADRVRVSRRSIKALLLEQYARGFAHADLRPSNVMELQRASGASYPTVAKALKELQAAHLLDDRAPHVALSQPGLATWQRIAEAYASERRTKRFVDPTGFASADQLLERLERLRKRQIGKGGRDLVDTVGIGGMFGARMFYPDLDLVGAPRLDLCVYDGDDTFVRDLDAGLRVSDDPHVQPVLVLHHTWDMRLESPSNTEQASRAALYESRRHGAIAPASIVDCYADLMDMGFTAQARDFAVAMTKLAE